LLRFRLPGVGRRRAPQFAVDRLRQAQKVKDRAYLFHRLITGDRSRASSRRFTRSMQARQR
jgi:hypothetical protein